MRNFFQFRKKEGIFFYLFFLFKIIQLSELFDFFILIKKFNF